jgi:hypothetical protein
MTTISKDRKGIRRDFIESSKKPEATSLARADKTSQLPERETIFVPRGIIAIIARSRTKNSTANFFERKRPASLANVIWITVRSDLARARLLQSGASH